MKENVKIWLKEGKQSKITPSIEKLAFRFSGNDFEKIMDIIKWIDKNLKNIKDNKQRLKIFAKRSVDKILKDGFSTGCHDNAVVFVTLCRAVGIPAKYVVGIDKFNPKNRGHCVAEVYINNNWILVDPDSKIINLDIEGSFFYNNYFIIGKGLDSWDVKIKSFKSWKEKSNKLIKLLSTISKIAS